MTCPHCNTVVKFDWKSSGIYEIDELNSNCKTIEHSACPNCEKAVIFLTESEFTRDDVIGAIYTTKTIVEKLIYPKKSNFEHKKFIPKIYLEDYEESIKVLSISPKSSAALNRRLLQSILREQYNIHKKNLALEIQEFIQKKDIPSHLTDAVDAIRNIGNLAAHPTKNNNTGEIVPVETGEAEWLIEVIESLFDFVFVQPKKLEERKMKLNEKLKEIGKPIMKQKN